MCSSDLLTSPAPREGIARPAAIPIPLGEDILISPPDTKFVSPPVVRLYKAPAATIGQVHHATNSNGVRLAVKVQYPNVRKSINSDLKLLSIFGKQFFKGKNFEKYLDEVRETLLEETDYLNEGLNIQKFRNIISSKEIIIPEYQESTSNEQVLTMTFLEGDHLDQMLKKEPDQNIKNN